MSQPTITGQYDTTMRHWRNLVPLTILEVTTMDTRLKEIVDNFETMKIGVDEPFKFHCTMCGKCCINREDILLTPRDIYNMSKELEITPEVLFKQYCETYIGSDSRIPIVRLKPRGSVKRCPLLKDRKCSVHKAKPTVCAMFPIGRCIMIDAKKESSLQLAPGDTQFIFTAPGCGDDTKTHTVREWLSAFGIPLEDEYFIKWQQTIVELGSIFRKVEKSFQAKTMDLAWTAAFVGLYLNYDMAKDFRPQFEENRQKLLELMRLPLACESGEAHV